MKSNPSRAAQLVNQLLEIARELSKLTGRHFTLDGHLVGSIGEVLAAEYYGLQLMPASTKGYDATAETTKIEIKSTFGDRVAFREHNAAADHCLVLRLLGDGLFDEVFNGPMRTVTLALAQRKAASNGQIQLSLNKLRAINACVTSTARLAKDASLNPTGCLQ